MNEVAATRGIDRPPGKIDIPSAWQGAEMKANPDRWLISLAASEIAELESAAKSYLGRSKKIADITRESFPLPRFSAHLEELKTKLLTGLGFEVIRGLPVAKLQPGVCGDDILRGGRASGIGAVAKCGRSHSRSRP